MAKRAGKKSSSNNAAKVEKSSGVEKVLIENFVTTQRVMVSLSSKIDNLATQISKLLDIFEISAKALAEKNFHISGDKGSEKIAQKIDTLLEQNKLIARGITLMHEINSPQEQRQNYAIQQRPLVPKPVEHIVQPKTLDESSGYQKSIASGDIGNFESPLPAAVKKAKKFPGI